MWLFFSEGHYIWCFIPSFYQKKNYDNSLDFFFFFGAMSRIGESAVFVRLSSSKVSKIDC